jgi:hypothetical protein
MYIEELKNHERFTKPESNIIKPVPIVITIYTAKDTTNEIKQL